MAPLPSSTPLSTTETAISSSKSPSVADRTDQFLKCLGSEYPLVKPLFLLQSQFQNFFQAGASWFPNSPPAIVSPLSTVCDPYLNIFRGIIPPLGGTLDLSPILAFLVLNAFTSTAAALPAELPASQKQGSSSATLEDLTAAQEKWMRRLSFRRNSKN